MPRKMSLVVSCVLGMFLMLVAGCVISPRRTPGQTGGGSTPSPTPTPTPAPGAPTGILYVSDQNSNSILRFNNAFTANGNIAPNATISGTATGLASPQYLALDADADRLFVANVNGPNVLVFDKVSTLSGNAAPTRVLNVIGNFVTPTDVVLDKGSDLLYVADGQEIFVLGNVSASTTSGSIQPVRDITTAFTIQALFLDTTNDRLYAADAVNNAIKIFDNASIINGLSAANRSITGPLTGLSRPDGITLDPAGNIVISNLNGSITVYAAANSSTGVGAINVAPIAAITGSSTTLASPGQMVRNLAPSAGEVFVADPTAGEVAVFSGVASAGGNTAPARNIVGSVTTITVAGKQTARGVALDTQR